MRKILFKAKRVDNGEWVEGYIYEHQPPLQCVSSDEPEKSKWYILRTAFADWNMPRGIEMVEVIPETVSQFTGLTDRNGKKIFEGDIVNCYEYECCGKIIYSEDGTGFYFLVALEEGGFEDEHLYDYAGELSIVGNIFDNPKLLEVTND